MAMIKGQTYRCTDEDCGCEIAVTKSSSGDSGVESPQCCCGSQMEMMHREAPRRSSDRSESRHDNPSR